MSHGGTQSTPDVRITGSHASPRSGAAVVHRELASRLARHLGELDVVDGVRGPEGFLQRISASSSTRARCCIPTSTPLPYRLRSEHLLPFVYDVRWRWTRGLVDRTYRHADLVRTARCADAVLTISHTVAEHLRALRIHEYTDVVVVDLGPGQLQGVAPAPVEAREPTILLIGDAPHKRNELAADLLAQTRSVTTNWRVVGISLSDATEAKLRAAFPESRLSLHREVPQTEFVDLASAATVYLALGVSEGFGFPYIEAAYLGCDVVAVRQSLTLELLGELAVLLPSATPSAFELEAALASWDHARVERLQARACARNWDETARQVAAVVQRLLGN